MDSKLPISVTIIAKDEEERLSYTLESIKGWVDEVILVDSGSTDNTLKIAEQYGAKIFHNDWKGYGQQKIFAENKVSNKWILNLDADEEVSPGLKNQIISLFLSNKQDEFPAYKMHWEMIFFTQEKPPALAVGSNFVRLYNKEKAGFNDSTVHDSVMLKNPSEKLGELKAPVYHRCFKSMKHWSDKINSYTSLQAEDWYKSGRAEPYCLRILFEPLFAFLKSYFIRRYIFYGIDGFQASLMYAYAKMLRLAKVREIFRLRKN